ncbi:MAG: asparagine synthase (glutamine-hydrolyzing), partial [bacterium]
GIPREVDAVALDEYLVYGYVPAPRTIFKHVLKVPAAHTLTLERGTLTLRRYWELSFTPTCHDDEEVALERTRELIRDAVRVRLVSDVPLGAFLSGGVDSSVVVGFMSQLLSHPVKTFSIGFQEADFNELPYARRVAEYFGADHHELIVGPDLVPSILPQLVWASDEPFGDSSMLPTYYVSKLAREHVTVALSGDGGDEMFAGYTHYRRERMVSRIPRLARQALGLGGRLMPDGIRGKQRLRNLTEALPLRYVRGMMLPRLGTRAGLYTPDHLASLDGHDPYARQTGEFAAVENLDVVTQMQYVDARNYLVDDILVKVDKASMFTSLETRMPLLDQHLVEYVASLQPSFRMPGGSLKYLLKRVAAELVPPEILTRRKQGFGMPVEHWIRKELAEYTRAMLESGRARQRGIFDPEFLSGLLDAHSRGRWVNHSRAIWSLLCLEVWFQTYLDAPVSPGALVRAERVSHHERTD